MDEIFRVKQRAKVAYEYVSVQTLTLSHRYMRYLESTHIELEHTTKIILEAYGTVQLRCDLGIRTATQMHLKRQDMARQSALNDGH